MFGLPGAQWPYATAGYVFDGGRLTDRQRIVGGPVVLRTSDRLVGTTESGTLITAEGDGGYELWDADGVRIGTIPHHTYSTSVLRGTRLFMESEGLRSVFGLRPDVWFDHLCANMGRAFTEEEREHLPPGTPSEAPC